MMMAEVPIPATGARNAGPDPLTGQWAHALTERQRDVLNLLSQGQPNKVIGRTLGISEGTVKIHLAAIFRVLKVRNRTEAVVAARELTGS
ncbi:MAG TPA: response regulator transcription factor, partial [Ottowia sp.]|nr:response regulator transcription factor [Ottowia sp.]